MMDLKNKRVLVVGLGKSGLSAAMFLREQGARVTVSDTRSAVALAKEIPALLEAGIMVESGGHGLLTFRRQDLIVGWPGEPLSARAGCGDYGIEWKDDDYDAGGEDICRCRCADASGREYRVASD